MNQRHLMERRAALALFIESLTPRSVIPSRPSVGAP